MLAYAVCLTVYCLWWCIPRALRRRFSSAACLSSGVVATWSLLLAAFTYVSWTCSSSVWRIAKVASRTATLARLSPSHSVALLLCEMRSARRGMPDETLPTARATQCWCLLLDNQTERPGTPCLVKEGASQTSRHSCAPPHWVRTSWYTSAILRVLSSPAWHAALASVLLGRDTVLCGKPMHSLGCWTGKDASLSKLTVFCPGDCDSRLGQIRVLSGFLSLALVVSPAAARVSSDVLRAQSLGLSGCCCSPPMSGRLLSPLRA